jgi:hypothetical protein
MRLKPANPIEFQQIITDCWKEALSQMKLPVVLAECLAQEVISADIRHWDKYHCVS